MPAIGTRSGWQLALGLSLASLAACSSEHSSSDEDAVMAGRPGADAAALDASAARNRSEAGDNPSDGGVDSKKDAGAGSNPSDGSIAPLDARDAGRLPDGGNDARDSRSDAGGARDASAPARMDAAAAPAVGRKFVGNITTGGQVRSDFASYWNQITPENEGKWGSVEATRNQMNWSGLDRAYQYAKQHGVVFKQHTFVWGSQQPTWLAGLSAAEQRVEVEEWIRLFCERYPDVALIDVVNEPPPHTTPVYLGALGGAGASGYDWIVQSFKWARQYCPKATLILNDYNNIEYGADNARFISIVNAIKAAGAPIDALGAQAHDAYKLSTTSVQQMIDKLASSTGLPVYITEYDINLANDAQQQQVMQSQFTMFWNDDNVKGITLWGYVVGATWQEDTGLIAASGTKRPAMTWLEGFLRP